MDDAMTPKILFYLGILTHALTFTFVAAIGRGWLSFDSSACPVAVVVLASIVNLNFMRAGLKLEFGKQK